MALLSRGLFFLALSCACPVSADSGKARPLFNGKDLTGWYTYTVETKYENPGIFTVRDGISRISGGDEKRAYYGGIITKESFANYHLVVEYKWGGPTWGNRASKSRDSGILLHGVGPDGPGPWPTSVECQIIEDGTGDFILVGGKDDQGKNVAHSLTVNAEKRGGQWYFNPQAPPVTVQSGRVNWYDRDPAWKDVLGYRGPKDLESRLNDWTRVECICKGKDFTYQVNGKVVNQGRGAALSKGKILLQTEGAEILFRKVDITSLD